MSKKSLLELAKDGHPNAIAALINHVLKSRKVIAKAERKDNHLRMMLESGEDSSQDELIALVCKIILKLEVQNLDTLQIFGKQVEDEVPLWSQTINLNEVRLKKLDKKTIEAQSNDNERKRVLKFFEKRREGFAGFLAGTLTDPVVGDLYDFLKEALDYRYLVPSIPVQEDHESPNTFDLSAPDVFEHIARHLRIPPDEISSFRSSQYHRFYYYPFDIKNLGRVF